MLHFHFRFSNFFKLLSRTVEMVPCCDWRNSGTSGTLHLDTSVGCATECCDILSRITGRTRWVDAENLLYTLLTEPCGSKSLCPSLYRNT